MSTNDKQQSGSWYSELNEAERKDLVTRVVKQLEQQEEASVPRRQLLKGAGVLGLGLAAGTGAVASDAINAEDLIGTASAGSNAAGQVGTASNPVDVFAEDIGGYNGNPVSFDDGVSSTSVDTDEVSLTDPSLVYAYGVDGNQLTAYDPANDTDVLATLNRIVSDANDSDQLEIVLPYTGASGVSASTTFSVPDAQVEPSIRGWGAYGTVINYSATDGTPAIEVANADNVAGPEWAHFALVGPGKAASGGGNGIDISGTVSHAQDFHHLRIESFPGTGFLSDGFITGSLHHCQIQHNGVRGLDLERLNGGSVHNNLIQRNGNATGNEQVLLTDCIGGFFGPGNVIDSRGGDTGTLTQVDGVLIESVSKRAAPVVLGNYFEDCATHITATNNGVPVAALRISFNRFQQGTTGVHITDDLVANGSRGGIVWANWFSSVGTQDILLDGGDIVLGPNTHQNSTTPVTDNTAGDFASVSKTAGSYPW